MSEPLPPRRVSKPRIIAMVVVDILALIFGVVLFIWLQPKDINAAFLALISCVVLGGFFDLVVVLVSLKP